MVVLPFDEAGLEGCTVGDVLADPDRFVGATMADPLEGPEYGRCKAKVMRRAGGEVWINSFAHGHTVYELKYAVDAVSAALTDTPDGELVHAFVRLVIAGDLTEPEIEQLRDEVCRRSGVGKRVVTQALRAAQAEQAGKVRNKPKSARRQKGGTRALE